MSRYQWAYRDRHTAWPLGCVAIRARHGQGKRHDTTHEAVIHVAARARGRVDTMRDTASQACDTVLCALPGRSARGLCAQAGSGCAPGAPNLVLDSVHCF